MVPPWGSSSQLVLSKWDAQTTLVCQVMYFLGQRVWEDLNAGNLQRFCSPLLPYSTFNISGE